MDRNCWYNLAASLLNTKRYDEADATLDTMLTLWPRDPQQMSMKAQVSLCKEDTVKAEEWTDKALEQDEYNGVALSLKASILLHRDSSAQADQMFTKALVQRPRESNLYSGRAIARYNQNNLRGAMADYDQAIELDSLSYASHYNRGLLRAQVGEDNKAVEDFNFVLRLDPTDIIAPTTARCSWTTWVIIRAPYATSLGRHQGISLVLGRIHAARRHQAQDRRHRRRRTRRIQGAESPHGRLAG